MFPLVHTLLFRWRNSPALRNVAWLAAEKALRLVLVTGVGFWVARHLGPGRYGILVTATALVGLFQPLAELGLEALARRQFLAATATVPRLATTVLLLRLASAACALVVLATVVGWGGIGGEERRLLVILAPLLFQPGFWLADSWLQTRLEARIAVLALVAATVAGALARVMLILGDAPLAAFAAVAVMEVSFGALLLAWAAHRRGFRYGHFDSVLARRLLREAWPLLLSGFAVMAYLRTDVVMLRWINGDRAAGIYTAATRLTEVWYFVPGAVAASLLGTLLAARAAGRRIYEDRMQSFYDLNAGLAFGLGLPTALLSPWIVRLAFGEPYAEAAPVLCWLAGTLVFIFLGVARGQYLVNEGHTGFYLASTMAGLLSNVGINLVLIPRYGACGAAAATLVAQAVATWLSTFCFAPVRANAWMQTRALLIPFRWYAYVRRT